MTKISVDEARANLDALIDRAKAGEEVILSRGDVDVRLVPVEASEARPRRVPGRFRGQLSVPDSVFDPLEGEDLEVWYR